MSKELIIKDKNVILIIRKNYVEKLLHFPGTTIKPIIETQSPIHYPEEFSVTMVDGQKYILTEKQYKTIKKWF